MKLNLFKLIFPGATRAEVWARPPATQLQGGEEAKEEGYVKGKGGEDQKESKRRQRGREGGKRSFQGVQPGGRRRSSAEQREVNLR